jgi:Zn-finger protein
MGKQEADSLKQFNIFFLKKHKYLQAGMRSGTITWSRNGNITGKISIVSYITENATYLECIYTQTDRFTGEKTDCDYKIQLTTTPCYFGGKRYWFICPWYSNGVYCGRRVGSLYLGDKYFACRHCYHLTYNSRNLSGLSKTIGQVISEPDIEELEKEVKRKYYAGKQTRRYKRLLKKEWKSMRQMQIMARGLESMYQP